MTEDSLPTDILAHMIAINNVPPPPLRSIPRLKVRKTINYGQLNALCHIRGLESRRNSSLYLAAHDTFIKQYPQIFLHEKTVLPKVPQPVEKRPVYRTIHEHNFVWKMLKNIPALTSQLRMIGDDGLYIMLTGHARRRVKVFRSLIEEEDSIVSSISRESFLFDVDLKDSTVVEFYVPSKKLTVKKWGVFGSLEVRPDMDECERSIVTDDDCEILKIPTKEYEKLKLEKVKRENAQKLKLIRKCPFYEIWPTLSIYELVSLSTFKIFPPGHVLVESGDIISFVGFINSGYCNIYRNIVGLVDLSLKVKKIKKLVYMGKLKERESFGEISILLQSPFTCTIITGREVEMAIIEDKDILALDPITKELMIQTAKPTFGHLTEEDVKNEYIKKVQEKEWKYFKNKTIQGIFQSKGVLPGFGKWEHDWSTIPKNFKSSLITYT
ncbi:cyclic nucleotide-binding domain-containing protein 1 isoform X7 [Rattus norvegicus]|uniref:cyclic nucleotide-binding domain-containing protein 1 isoform X7 n=1 Tax=Rattus norvegicus TaxID=10116 RepID=UPI0019176450|nr:cyclic nucleotide-binding domain-containing protein 1 isoform X7 [Rattus norvegicus]